MPTIIREGGGGGGGGGREKKIFTGYKLLNLHMNISMSNSTSNVIEMSVISIALQVLLIPNSTGYLLSLANSRPAFKKSFAIVAILYRSLAISLFQD